MATSNDYDQQLRSYVEQRTNDFQRSIESIARNRTNQDANVLEREIERESDKLKKDITNRINSIRDQIKSHRPTDERQPDYQKQMKNYQQFVTSASTGIQIASKWIDKIFDKVLTMVKQFVQWIVDQANNIIDILNMIRDAFHDFLNFISH